MKRAAVIAVAVVAFLAAAAFGVRSYMVWDRRRDKLPAFTEIPPGQRAPKGQTILFGLDVGRSTLTNVEAWEAARGLKCVNTSMRALMEEKRQEIKRQMKEAKANGDDPDGVTGASLADYHSRKEQNPQVRLSCEDVAGAALADRPRDDEKGRVLIVLDSDKLPVRHISFAPKFTDPALALEKLKAATAAMTARFGPPTKSVNGAPDGDEPFPPLKIFKREWRFTDLRAEVSAMSFGKRGVEVKETLEVPWPVRSDAPTRPDAPR